MMDHEKLENAFKENKRRLEERMARYDAKSVPVHEVNVKAIRNSLGMSQSEFASAFWLSLNSIRNWEQGIRKPEGPAKAYLTAIRYDAEAVIGALSRSMAERYGAKATLVSDVLERDTTIGGEAMVGDFDNNRIIELTGRIESLSPADSGQALAASTKKASDEVEGRPIAQLVDVSGLSFAKLFLNDDASVHLEISVSGQYNSVAFDGHEYEIGKKLDGLNEVVGLSVAELLSLINGGLETVSLRARAV